MLHHEWVETISDQLRSCQLLWSMEIQVGQVGWPVWHYTKIKDKDKDQHNNVNCSHLLLLIVPDPWDRFPLLCLNGFDTVDRRSWEHDWDFSLFWISGEYLKFNFLPGMLSFLMGFLLIRVQNNFALLALDLKLSDHTKHQNLATNLVDMMLPVGCSAAVLCQ